MHHACTCMCTEQLYYYYFFLPLDYLLNTGQLPRMRSLSVDRRSSVYQTTATPANSPPSYTGNKGGLTTSTVEMASTFKNAGADDNGALISSDKASAL